jgi:hypothetical protein
MKAFMVALSLAAALGARAEDSVRQNPVLNPGVVPPGVALGTLAYHLSTNAVGHASQFTGVYRDTVEFTAPASANLDRLTKAVWSTNFWLEGACGLCATPIGFTNLLGGQGLPTMVSPRHYLCATHMHQEGYTIAFLDTNNVVHWRRTLQRSNIGFDISVGLLNEDLPPSVGYLPVLPPGFTNCLPNIPANGIPRGPPTDTDGLIQGIGMNQDMRLFGQPMILGNPLVTWNNRQSVPFGLSTNWNVAIRSGDSSNPEMLLVGNQLVLVSHNFVAFGGPNYAFHFNEINREMHHLSTNNHLHTDYQLTPFPLTNWPAIHPANGGSAARR